jgi:hypothetical protein
MTSFSIADTISKVISTVVVPVGGFLAILYFVGKKVVEKAVDSRFDERLESLSTTCN